jgi:hypothetical protein
MKVHQPRLANGRFMKKRRRHSPKQIVKKLRDADAMLAAGKSVGKYKRRNQRVLSNLGFG